MEETKEFLAKLRSPKIIIHKEDKLNDNLIDICTSQAEDALSRNRNYSWIRTSLESLANFLKIDAINKVEGFDISHTSGRNVSASCVCVTKEGPVKKKLQDYEYKKRF